MRIFAGFLGEGASSHMSVVVEERNFHRFRWLFLRKL